MIPEVMERFSETLEQSPAVQVRLFQNGGSEEAKLWDDYVHSQKRATIDHLWKWRKILSEAFGFIPYYLAAFSEGRVVGILPLFLIPRGFGKWSFSSIPYGNYGGICADHEQASEALLQRAKELVLEKKAQYLELHHRTPVEDSELQSRPLYARFIRPLEGNTELFFAQMGTKNRNKVKKALKSGLSIEPSRDVEALYEIHLRTSRRQGTPCFPKKYFELIFQEFKENAEIQFVILGGRKIAYMGNLYFKDEVMCLFNGSLEEFYQMKPNNLLYWHQVGEGFKRGLRLVDHGRSRIDSGAAAFKRQFHLKEEILGYQYYVPGNKALPTRNPSNPKYRKVIETWQRLPLRFTAFAGPRIVRYLA